MRLHQPEKETPTTAIATLRKPGQRKLPATSLFARGNINVGRSVELTKRFFDLCGADTNEVELHEKYSRLASLGYKGRFCPRLPAAISFEHLLNVVESLRPWDVDSADIWEPLWASYAGLNALTRVELDGSDQKFSARLLLYSATPSSFGRALHFCGTAYDKKYREHDKPSQRKSINQAVAQFAINHNGANLQPADARDALVCIGIDRLADINPKSADFFLGRGSMMVYDRRTIGGDSVVACVSSNFGQICLDKSSGRAAGSVGIGLSVGFAT